MDILQNEFFNNYSDEFEVKEYIGYSMDQVEELKFDLGLHIGYKHAASVFPYCETLLFDFVLGENPLTGIHKFGVVGLEGNVNNKNIINAMYCMYILKVTFTSKFYRDALASFCRCRAYGELNKMCSC